MAVGQRNVAQATTQTSGTLTISDPGNAGDYEILFVMCDVSGAGGWSTPSGWTALFANDQLSAVDGATIGLFYRQSAVGSGSVSITIPNGSGTHACGCITAFTGADSSQTPGASGHALADSAHTDPWGVTTPSITPSVTGCGWWVGAVVDPNTASGTDIWIPPVGSSVNTPITDVSGWNSMDVSFQSAALTTSASGTTTITLTRGGSASAAYAGYAVAIPPAAVAATPTLPRPRPPAPEPQPEDPPSRRRAFVPPAGPGPAVYARRRSLPIEPEEQPPLPPRRLQAFPLVQGPAVYARKNAPPDASGEAQDAPRRPMAFVPPAPAVIATVPRPRPLPPDDPPFDPSVRRVQFPFSLVQGAAVYAKPRPPLVVDADIEVRSPQRLAFVPSSVVVQTVFRRPPPPAADPDPDPTPRPARYPFSLEQGAAVYARPRVPQPENDPEGFFPPRRTLVPPTPAVVPVFAKLPPGKSLPADDEFFPLPKRRLPFSLVQGSAVYARAHRRPELEDEPLIARARPAIIPPAPAVVPVRFRRIPIVREDEDALIARPQRRLYVPSSVVPITAIPPFVARFIDTHYPQAVSDESAYETGVREIGTYPMSVEEP